MAKPPKPPPAKPSASPFAVLESLRGSVPHKPVDDVAARTGAVAPENAAAPGLGGKIVIGKSRKGRGGKTVTVVTGIELGDAALEELARELRRALGCGVVVEGRALVAQGIQHDRLAVLLEARGATRIVIGS